MDLKTFVKISIIIAAITSYSFIALAYPLTGHADTITLLDYSWQISQGIQPDFYDGTNLPYDIKQTDIQFAAHHPPLYYKVISPITSYLIDNGYTYRQLVLGTRFVNVAISLLTLIFIAIYADCFNLFKKRHFDLVFLTFFAFYLPFAKVSGLIFSESLLLLFIAAAWISSVNILKFGYNHSSYAILLICTALGMYTKVSYLSTLLITLMIMFAGIFLYSSNSSFKIRQFFSTSSSVLLILAAAFLVSGSFYYGNYELSGSFLRAAEQSWITQYTDREYKDFFSVASNSKIWGYLVMPKIALNIHNLTFNNILYMTIGIFSLIGYFAFFSALYKNYCRNKLDYKQAILATSFIFLILIVIMQMIFHATGYGAYNARYLLPAIIAIAAVITNGLLTIPKIGNFLPVIYLLLGSFSILTFLLEKYGIPFYSFDLIEFISFSDTTELLNGVPFSILGDLLTACIVTITISLILTLIYTLQSKNNALNNI